MAIRLQVLYQQRPQDMLQIISQSIVADVLPRPTPALVSIPSSASISEAIQILTANGVTSAPLFDVSNMSYSNFVEMFDILRYLIQCFIGKVRSAEANADAIQYPDVKEQEWREFAGDLDSLKFKGMQFSNHNIRAVLGSTKADPTPLHAMDALADIFFKLENTHRCIVHEGPAYYLVTQSDVVRFLAKKILMCQDKARHQTLLDLGLAKKMPEDILCPVTPAVLAIDAFYRMYLHGLSCLPVIDNGKLLAQVSQTDLRGLQQTNFPNLLKPLGDWLAENVPDLKVPPIEVHPWDTLEHTLLLFASSAEHNIWIVDEQQHPVRSLTLNDLIDLIYKKLDLGKWWEEDDKLAEKSPKYP